MPGLPRDQPDRLLARQHGLGIDSQTYQTGGGDPAELRDLVDALLTITNRRGSQRNVA